VCLAFGQPDDRIPEAAVDNGRLEARVVDFGGNQPATTEGRRIELALQRSRFRPGHGEIVEAREAVEGADVPDHTGTEPGPWHKPLMRRRRTTDMNFVVRAWPPDGEALDLDHEQFIYGGKFNTGRTAKALALDDGDLVGAVAFNEDRAAADALRIRYVSVREDRRAEGIGPRLLHFAADRARDHGYDRVRIAVNNPYAYEACYRAGFSFTGDETGIAELVMTFPTEDRSPERYREGFAIFADRDLPADQAEYVADADATPPTAVETPTE